MRLEALERSRSAFIANASHELRTPLTALGGYLELLTEGGLTRGRAQRVPRRPWASRCSG